MTPEEELAMLIAEQEKDDTYRVVSRVPHGFRAVPLNAKTPSGKGTIGDSLIGVTMDGEIVSFFGRDASYDRNTTCGIASSYTNRGCRCPDCTEAFRVAHLEWYARNRKQKGETRSCAICGTEFHTLQEVSRQGKRITNNWSAQKYCSTACKRASWREKDRVRQAARRAALRQQRQAVTA